MGQATAPETSPASTVSSLTQDPQPVSAQRWDGKGAESGAGIRRTLPVVTQRPGGH